LLRRSERREARFAGLIGDQSREIPDAVEHGPDRDKAVILAFKMGANAGPRPVLRAGHEPRPDRIERDITDGGDQVAVVHGNGREPAIEQMTPPTPSPIDEIGPPAMRRTQRPAEPGFIARAENEMDVVGHQTVCPNLHIRLAHLLGEHVAIDVLIAVFEKYRLAPVAARRHVMRISGNDDARETSHARPISRRERKVNNSPVAEFAPATKYG